MSAIREFDIILLGATGYTGSLAAEHIARTFPTNLKWAIAGRSTAALDKLSEHLKTINADRIPPSIETTQLDVVDLNQLVAKTRVVVNTIGPFSRFSSPIVEACAKHGIHYVDTTTETLWIKEIIDKYHPLAVQNGAKIIPAISLSSSPSDLLAWLSATKIKQHGGLNAVEVIVSGKLEISGMSSGSLASVLDVRDKYGSAWYLFGDASILSPSSKLSQSKVPWLSLIFGYRYATDLGILTTSFVAPGNSSVVHRSASLNPSLYGPNFNYSEYSPAPNMSTAVFIHVLTNIFNVLLSFSLFRWGISKIAPAPGSGPDIENSREKESVEFKAIATSENGKVKVGSKWEYKGSTYEVSAMMAVEGAGVLLGWSKERESSGDKRDGGGIATPSALGMEFVERLRGVGVVIEAEVLRANALRYDEEVHLKTCQRARPTAAF